MIYEGKMNFLIIDDVYSELTAMRKLFSKYGFCSIAQTALGAVQELHKAYIENDNFDVIVADLEMPKKNGIDLLEIIRNDEKALFIKPAKKILLISGNIQGEMLQIVRKNCDDILVKPSADKYIRRALINVGLVAI